MNAITTQGGLRGWIGRAFERMSLAYKIAWAEQDRDTLALMIDDARDHGPNLLRQMDRDLEELRVRLALLRG